MTSCRDRSTLQVRVPDDPIGSSRGTQQWLNHIALLTGDVDAFTAFYVDVFDAEVLFDMKEDGLRHAAVDVGAGAALHAFAVPDNPQAAASTEMFNRGHIDHLAINVEDETALYDTRRRLVARAASDGTVTDFGMLKSIHFPDPDGLAAEVALWRSEPPRRFDERITTPNVRDHTLQP